MTPSYNNSTSDLLEQAHLAMTRGQLKEARLMLEVLLAGEPANAPAQSLLAMVVVKQDVENSRLAKKPAWARWSIPNDALSNLVVGLAFVGIGLQQMVSALQTGIAHGFGPGSTITTTDKYGLYMHQVPLSVVLWHSCLPLLIGFVLLYLFFRQK